MVEDSSKNFYVGNAEAWKKIIIQKRFSDRNLDVKVIERGIVLPARQINKVYFGGVCDANLNFVAGFTRVDPISKKYGKPLGIIEAAYAVKKEDIVQLDEDVIFGGSLIGHFGHFMLECWSRLWYVVQHPELKSKILFVTTTHGGYHSWFDEFFRLMGIEKERIIYVKKPMQCRSVTVPEQAAYTPVSFTKEFLLPYQAIKSNVKPSNHKKLYLTRTNFESDSSVGVHCYNEKYFEDFFAAHGFEVVSTEKLTVEEQISLIMGADEIAATLGTLTHWIMFCKPSAKFIMLNRVSAYVSGYQCLILEASKFSNYYVVDASKNFMYANRTLGVILLGSNKYWKEFVADYFGERIDEDDDATYFENSLDKYIRFWFKKYPMPRNLNVYVSSLKNLSNQIIMLEKNLPSNALVQKFDIQAMKISLTKLIYAI